MRAKHKETFKMEKGLLVVISGPAGSGKGTVIKELLKNPDFVYSVSATTRAPRPGEIHGKNYYFITREEFEERLANSEMLEYTCYCNNFYGTPLREALEVVASGKNLILELEVEGAMNVKRLYPEAVLIMLLPPSFAVQEARLRGRATETEEVILARLERTKEEVPLIDHYDYVVYNNPGEAEVCAEDIQTVVRADRHAMRRHPDAAKRYFED